MTPVNDGKALTISLPAKIDRFPTERENFDWYKVVLTHQAGHFEFGTFDFRFDRRSSCFDDWRPPARAKPHGAERERATGSSSFSCFPINSSAG